MIRIKLVLISTLTILMIMGVSKSMAAQVDSSLLPLCEEIINQNSSVKNELKNHNLVKKMSEGMENVGFTPDEFATSAFNNIDDPRFSFNRLIENGQYVNDLISFIHSNKESLINEISLKASEFLGIAIKDYPIKINLVCGGKWDAYVLIFNDTPEIFMDVGWYADKDKKRMIDDFRAVLTHEMWHFGFYNHKNMFWEKDYRNHVDKKKALIYQILNEGVGHYYSLYNYLYPKVSIKDFDSKIESLASRFHKKYNEYIKEDNPERVKKLQTRFLWNLRNQIMRLSFLLFILLTLKARGSIVRRLIRFRHITRFHD